MFMLRRQTEDVTAAVPSKVAKVMHEFKAGELHSGKNGLRVRSRKQAIAIAMSEQRKAMTADAFTAEQRRKMASTGEALPDGSYPIPNVEYLRKAIGALGRASQHGDYERVKRHIVKRARALDAVAELPEDWNVTAAVGDPFTVRENDAGRFEVVNPDGAKVAETTSLEDAQKICDEKNGMEEMDDMNGQTMVAAVTPGQWATLPADDPEMDAIVAAIPVVPPAGWFAVEEPDEPTPITVTEEGMIYGHAAIWGTCHLGNPRGAGVCVQPPVSQTDYALFHLGEIEAAGGERIPVGQITLDTGHAPLGGTSARTAAAHYDDTGTVVADVRATNGKLGIWYSGALRPDVTAEKLRKLLAAKISGDWRGGELVGMLCVNVPGFPVPRTAARIVASADGTEEVMALVAAGIVGETRDRSDIEVEIRVLAARAEGGIEALAELAASGIASA